MSIDDRIKEAALVADRIENSARTMERASRHALADGDKAGAVREWCIAAREYDWAGQVWDAIGFVDRAAKCRDLATAVRAGECPDCGVKNGDAHDVLCTASKEQPQKREVERLTESFKYVDEQCHRIGNRNAEAMRILGVEFGHPTEGVAEGAQRVVDERDKLKREVERLGKELAETKSFAEDLAELVYADTKEATEAVAKWLSTQGAAMQLAPANIIDDLRSGKWCGHKEQE